MTRAEIEAGVFAVLAEQMGMLAGEMSHDEPLGQDGLDMDDLDAIDAMNALERAFGIRIHDGEWDNLVDVQNVVELVAGKVGKPPTTQADFDAAQRTREGRA